MRKNIVKTARKIRVLLILSAITIINVLTISDSKADWNANVTGYVYTIYVAYTGTIGFNLSSSSNSFVSAQPVTGCTDNSLFLIDASSPSPQFNSEARKNFMAQLMFAKSMNQPVRIGYDSGSNCFGTNPQPYAISVNP